MGNFDDLIPKKSGGNFDDLIPKKKESPRADFKSFAFGGAPGYSVMPGGEDSLPLAGQVIGSLGGPASAIAGTAIGEGGKNIVKSIRGEQRFGGSDLLMKPSAAGDVATTAAFEGLFGGIQKAAGPAANRMMLSIMKPSRDVIKRSPNLGTEALDLGIVGSKDKMLDKAENIVNQSENEVSKILSGSNKRIDAKKIIDSLESAKANANAGLKPEDANAIESVKQNFVEKIPNKTIQEPRGFVTSVGKKIEPQITRVKGSDVSNKVAPLKYDEIWNQYKPEVITPKKFIENPEDIVALHNPGEGANVRKLTSISPKITYSIDALTSPEYTQSKEVFDRFGMNFEDAQALKKAIYSETPDAAFNRAMQDNPGTTEARRLIASGIRREIAAGEPSVAEALKKESTALKVKKALADRIANEQKSVVLPFFETTGAIGGMATGNPLISAAILARRGLSSPAIKSNIAKSLFGFSKRPELGKAASFGFSEASRKLFK